MSRGASRPDELHWAALSCVAERNNKQIVELNCGEVYCDAERRKAPRSAEARSNKQIVELP